MPRVHLDTVTELDEPAERVEEPLGALAGVDRQVGPGGVADEERVAGEHDPRVLAAAPIADGEAAVLRPVSRRVDATQNDVSEDDLLAILQRVVRIRGVRAGWMLTGITSSRASRPCPERWSACVCLDRPHDANLEPLGLLDVLLDRERRVDDDRLARPRIADEVGSTPERIVDELREDHGRADGTTGLRYFS